MFENLKAFYAESMAEFKKISWPSWDEIKGSTAVVCVTILFLMSALALYDSIVAPCVEFIMKAHK